MPDPNYALFKVTASALTPLHIGSGDELLNEYDYAIFNKRTWRINDASLLEAQDVEDPALAERLASIPPAQLLKPEDYVAGSSFFRYVIRGTPRSQAAGAVLREQIKDSFDRLYLPGSSLKGALRTAMGWYAWAQKDLKPDAANLGFRREWAAQNYEHTLFGPNPNKDALRALQVSDSEPLGIDHMMIVNASVINASGKPDASIPVELEAIRPETVFTLRIKVDLALYSDWARRAGLRLEGLDWMLQLPAVLQAHARQRVDAEVEWYSRQPAASRLLTFYQQLAAAHLEPNQALVQLGWGTGWDGTTFGSRLRADPDFMQQVVAKFRLSRSKTASAAFPRSRRSAVSFSLDAVGRRVVTPIAPLGWVLLTFEPIQDIPADWKGLVKPVAAPPPVVKPAPQPAQPVDRPAPADQPPAAPAPKPAAPPSAPIIQRFSRPPRPGDRFKGRVVESLPSGKITLEIPGIDPDETGMAVVPPQNNPGRAVFPEKRLVLCQVERIETAKDGYTWAVCRLEA